MLIETVLIFLATMTSYDNGTPKTGSTTPSNQTEVNHSAISQNNTTALRGGWDGN